jgi:hypothetical protein
LPTTRTPPASASCSPLWQAVGRTKLIATNWAHSIDFMFHMVLKPGQPSKSYHFCVDYRYGIQGCGRATLLAATKQLGCLVCALKRLATSNCPKYILIPIRKAGPSNMDHQQWMTLLSNVRWPRDAASTSLLFTVSELVSFACCHR